MGDWDYPYKIMRYVVYGLIVVFAAGIGLICYTAGKGF